MRKPSYLPHRPAEEIFRLAVEIKALEQKHNRYHDPRSGRFASSGISAPGGLAEFPEKEQQAILAHMQKNGIDKEQAVARGSVLIEHSLAQGHHEADADWYNRANEASSALAKKFGVSQDEAAGVVASLSPRNPWDNLVRGQVQKSNLKDAITITKYVKTNPTVNVTPELVEAMTKYEEKTGLSSLVGTSKPLSDFSPIQVAYLVSSHIRSFPVNTEKAVRILRGETPEEVLGGAKVRSFYNNIRYPEKQGNSTIDTWMISALTGKKGNASEMGKLISNPSSGKLKGVGSYPFFVDVMDAIGKKHNMAPHEAQAVIWQQARREKGYGAG